MEVKVLRNILDANDSIAAENARILAEARVFCVNLMSSPGSGKTSILERTMEVLSKDLRIGVIEGDIRTTCDADRLLRFGIPIVQINTEPFGGGCHLEANMVRKALLTLPVRDLDILFIENLGNLVCPAEFRLGSDANVLVLSITEGEDKPLKYPLMFRVCHLLLMNKMDLRGYLDIDLEALQANIASVNPHLPVIKMSARTAEGFDEWIRWLKDAVERKRS